MGVASILSWLLYKSGSDYSFPKTDDPANIVKEIVDAVSTWYPNLVSYDDASVQAYGTAVSVSYARETCLESMKKTVSLTDYWWTVDGTGKLHFKPKSAGTVHFLTFGKHVDTLEIEENAEKIVNEYFLDWSS